MTAIDPKTMAVAVLPKCELCGYVILPDLGDKSCGCYLMPPVTTRVPKQKSAFHFVVYCWSLFGKAADELLRAEIAEGNRRNQRMAEFHRHLRTLRDAITEVLDG